MAVLNLFMQHRTASCGAKRSAVQRTKNHLEGKVTVSVTGLALELRKGVHLQPSPTWLILSNWKNTIGHLTWPHKSLFPAA